MTTEKAISGRVFVTILALLCAVQTTSDAIDPSIVTHEMGITELTDDTFFDHIKRQKNVLVLFRDRTCDDCPQIQEDMRQSIRKFVPEEQGWSIGRLNVHKYHHFLKLLQMVDFPKVRFYFDNEFHTTLYEYPSQHAIEGFIQGILGSKTQSLELKTEADFESFKSSRLAMLLSFPDYSESNMYFANTLQKVFPQVQLWYTLENSEFDRKLFAEGKPQFKFLLWRLFDDGNREVLSSELFQAETILTLVDVQRHEKMRRIDAEGMQQILSHKHGFAIVFDKEINSPAVKTTTNFLLNLHYTGLMFRSTLTEERIGAELGRLLGVTEADMPVFMFVKNHHQRFQKYRHTGEFSQSALQAFLDRHVKGEVPEYFKKQHAVEQRARRPHELTAATFDHYIKQSKKNVLVFFYKHNDKKSNDLRKELHHVANVLKDENNIEIVQTDVSTNDYLLVTWAHLPQLFLYPLDRKTEPVEYKGRHFDSDIVAWMQDELQQYLHRKHESEIVEQWDL